MSIVLKHIFRNIKAHKMRSVLIFLALMISTCVLIIDIILPDELLIKIEDTFKNIYGNADISINSVEDFEYGNLKFNGVKYDYVVTKDINATNKDDKPAQIIGIDINKAKDFKLLGEDVPELNENEVIINEYTAKEKGYKKDDIITLTYEGKQYQFIVKEIVKKKGIASIESEYDMFISSIDTTEKIANEQVKKYSSIYLDVENDDEIDSLVEYLKDNNDNYNINRTIDMEGLKEEVSFVRYLMTLIFFMSTIMIFFVIGSLNKIMLAERIPVIGTFRSIGANRSKMNSILIIENALYGLFAGAIGAIAGIYLDSLVSKAFINAEGVELSHKSVTLSPSLIIIGILFAMLLQVFITAKEIIRTNKKPIKTLIFNTQSSRYKIRKRRTVVGFILIILSFVVHILNKDINILFTMVSLVSLSFGVASIVPFLMQQTSKLLAALFKKMEWSTGIIASKNIGYNKMIISSSRLIVVSLSLLSTIVLISASFTKLFTGFRETTKGYDMTVMGVRENATKYDKLVSIEGINEVKYLYYYFDEQTTYNDNKKFTTVPLIYTAKKDDEFIKWQGKNITELNKDEIIIDEKVAFKNKLKVGDKIKITYGDLNKTFEYKIVGLCDSSNFTTSRNLIALNYEHYIKDITDVPMQVLLVTDKDIDFDKMKDTLKKEIKEVSIKIQTTEEYISEQEAQTASIMSIFYVILGLSVFLSFIGIINNQIISFIQRRRELAILNSTCMSKAQIRKMLFTETILANIVASIFVFITSYASVGFINYFMQGLEMYITVPFNFMVVFKFVGFVYIILLFTLIIPAVKLNKMKIVNEIKYE